MRKAGSNACMKHVVHEFRVRAFALLAAEYSEKLKMFGLIPNNSGNADVKIILRPSKNKLSQLN